MGMDDKSYPNSVSFTMEKFEHNLYIYYFNGLNLSPRIHMNFKSSSSDPVQGNNFLNKTFGHNAVR